MQTRSAHLVATLPADQKRVLQLASAQNRTGNASTAAGVGKSSAFQAPNVPSASKPEPKLSDGF